MKQTIQLVKENLHLSAGDAEKRVILKSLVNIIGSKKEKEN